MAGSLFASDTAWSDAAKNDITLVAPGRYDFNGFGGHAETNYMGVSPFQTYPANSAGWATTAPYYLPWYFERNSATDPGWDRLRYDGDLA